MEDCGAPPLSSTFLLPPSRVSRLLLATASASPSRTPSASIAMTPSSPTGVAPASEASASAPASRAVAAAASISPLSFSLMSAAALSTTAANASEPSAFPRLYEHSSVATPTLHWLAAAPITSLAPNATSLDTSPLHAKPPIDDPPNFMFSNLTPPNLAHPNDALVDVDTYATGRAFTVQPNSFNHLLAPILALTPPQAAAVLARLMYMQSNLGATPGSHPGGVTATMAAETEPQPNSALRTAGTGTVTPAVQYTDATPLGVLDSRPKLGFKGISGKRQLVAGVNRAYSGTQFDPWIPDSAVCVGRLYIVQIVNYAIVIYNKRGKIVRLPQPLNEFFGVMPANSTRPGDFINKATCVFDASSGRFFLAAAWLSGGYRNKWDRFGQTRRNADGSTSGYGIVVAASSFLTPLMAWNVSFIPSSNDGVKSHNDTAPPLRYPGRVYWGATPRITVDRYGVYLTTRQYAMQGKLGRFVGSNIYAIHKPKLYVRSSKRVVRFAIPMINYNSFPVFGLEPQSPRVPRLSRFKGQVTVFFGCIDISFTSPLPHTSLALWSLSDTSSLMLPHPTLRLRYSIIDTPAYYDSDYAKQKAGPPPYDTPQDVVPPTSTSVAWFKGHVWMAFPSGYSLDPTSVPSVALVKLQPFLRGKRTFPTLVKKFGIYGVPGQSLLSPPASRTSSGRSENRAEILPRSGSGSLRGETGLVRSASKGEDVAAHGNALALVPVGGGWGEMLNQARGGAGGLMVPAAMAQESSDVVMGILWKWVNLGRGWGMRLFILEGGALSFFKLDGPDKAIVLHELQRRPGARLIGDEIRRYVRIERENGVLATSLGVLGDRTPHGQIELHVSTIRASTTDNRKFYVFGHRTLGLRTESKAGRSLWMEAIENARVNLIKRLHAAPNKVDVSSHVCFDAVRTYMQRNGVEEEIISGVEELVRRKVVVRLETKLREEQRKRLQLLTLLRQLEAEKVELETAVVDEKRQQGQPSSSAMLRECTGMCETAVHPAALTQFSPLSSSFPLSISTHTIPPHIPPSPPLPATSFPQWARRTTMQTALGEEDDDADSTFNDDDGDDEGDDDPGALAVGGGGRARKQPRLTSTVRDTDEDEGDTDSDCEAMTEFAGQGMVKRVLDIEEVSCLGGEKGTRGRWRCWGKGGMGKGMGRQGMVRRVLDIEEVSSARGEPVVRAQGVHGQGQFKVGFSYPHVPRRMKLPDPEEEEKPLSLWSVLKECMGKDMFKVGFSYPHVPRRLKLPDPEEEEKPLSLWSVLKECMGKDMFKVSLPVSFNEPLSSSQKYLEMLEYSWLLDRAAEYGRRGNRLMRAAHVAAFAVSRYSGNDGRMHKPFNPFFSPVAALPPSQAGQPVDESSTRGSIRSVTIFRQRWAHAQALQPAAGGDHRRGLSRQRHPLHLRVGNDGRMHKPFNPLLGETTEGDYPDKGIRYISESVVHYPPMIAWHVDGTGWKFWGDVCPKIRFWGPSIQLDPVGVLTVQFDDGETYAWSNVTVLIQNLILGKPFVEHYGTMRIKGNRGYSARLRFKERSTFDRNPHQVRGLVQNEAGDEQGTLMGRWDQHMHYVPGDLTSKTAKEESEVLATAQLIWKKNPVPPNTKYKFTPFTITLNELPPSLKECLPPTDSRLREDQRALEEGRYDFANQEKCRLEQRQRKALKDGEPGWGPRWFKPSGPNNTWRYTGGYWERREKRDWSGVLDMFAPEETDGDANKA
ncbi:unnamed protein product [Closterium sp. Naga37s-1]|nr:unnamed protein product [Closterium sp. Naga37s-1]